MHSVCPASQDQDEIEQMAEYSANLYAKTPEEKASYLLYYREYYQKQNDEARIK
jgi:RNA-binding protein 5/10